MKNFFTWFEDYEIEKTVFKLMLKGVVLVAFLMAGLDWFLNSHFLSFLELAFAIVSMVLLYSALANKVSYSFSTRIFILVMSLPIYWNLLYNESSIESSVLFIFLPIITGILRPIKEVVFLGAIFGGSFLVISVLGLGNAQFTFIEVFKLVSTQALISFFVIIYVQTNRQYQEVIATQSHQLQEAHKNLEALYKEKEIEASTDHLTGLANRAAFMSRIDYLYARYNRQKEVFSLVLLDIDKFKSVNDTYGHQEGDKVLKIIADILQECVREVDTVARYGGEEFILLLPQTNIVAANHVAERIRESIESTAIIKDRVITASFGVIEIEEGLNVDLLIRKADEALYNAKANGRNQVVCA